MRRGARSPDEQARSRAQEVLLKASAEYRKLHGADAPKKTMAITHEMIAERIMELKRELGLSAEEDLDRSRRGCSVIRRTQARDLLEWLL